MKCANRTQTLQRRLNIINFIFISLYAWLLIASVFRRLRGDSESSKIPKLFRIFKDSEITVLFHWLCWSSHWVYFTPVFDLTLVCRRPWCGAPMMRGAHDAGHPWCEAPMMRGVHDAGPPWCGAPMMRGTHDARRPWCGASMMRGVHDAGRPWCGAFMMMLWFIAVQD